MKILADENIRYVRRVFSEIGEVYTTPGRDMTAEDVEDIDILLVRSVTEVGPALLQKSSVQFVGTATIGMDHIDTEYLEERGIAFSNAAGSNANSVAEYVVSALFALSQKYDFELAGTSLGVVGVGNVGSCVVEKATALGMKTVLNDPPLARETNNPMYSSLEETLDCDIVTLHVPLTFESPDATFRLANDEFFRKMGTNKFLINTSRGKVVVREDLERAREKGRIKGVTLDVWPEEPNINIDLLQMVDIATPHIAGYSLDGKAKGTAMIYDAVCDFLNIEPPVDVMSFLPEPEVPEYKPSSKGSVEDCVRETVFAIYDVLQDDSRLRKMTDKTPEARAAYFDQLRRDYPQRREFYNTRVDCGHCSQSAKEILCGLGFDGKL